MLFDEKQYLCCGKGFRKLIFKLLIWYIARTPLALRDEGEGRRRFALHVELDVPGEFREPGACQAVS